MRGHPIRRKVPHWEHVAGTVCLTWRLHHSQPPLRGNERDLVLETIRRGDGTAGDILAAVVMDDHVHVLISLSPEWSGQRTVQTWKSVSSHRMTKECGRLAPVWQAAYFDRWIRTEERIRRATEYIMANPERRWPGIENYPWVIAPRWLV